MFVGPEPAPPRLGVPDFLHQRPGKFCSLVSACGFGVTMFFHARLLQHLRFNGKSFVIADSGYMVVSCCLLLFAASAEAKGSCPKPTSTL